MVEYSKVGYSSHSKSIDDIRRCAANRFGIRKASRETQVDAAKDSSVTSHVLRLGMIEALLIFTSVEFGVYRNVVTYV